MNLNRDYRGVAEPENRPAKQPPAAPLLPADFVRIPLFQTLYTLMANGFWGKVTITFENGVPVNGEDTNKWGRERLR